MGLASARPSTTVRSAHRTRLLALLAATACTLSCGKKGPPLPPVSRLPIVADPLVAERRDTSVTIRFAVPARNSDGSTPADVTRVDIYALTGPATVTATEIVARGAVVGSVPVNPPADPDAPPDAPKPTVEGGVDQGAAAHVDESIVVGTSAEEEVRSYAAVGVTRRGRRGVAASVARASLQQSPPTPASVTTTYDEKMIAIEWPTAEPAESVVKYHVYETGEAERRLTTEPLESGSFQVAGATWDVERCFVVRAITTIESLTIESEASSRACVTPKDTFPPLAPSGLQTVPEAGAVSLIWNPSDDAELAGYLVLRAIAPETTLTAVTPAPIAETTYRDVVPAGARVTYAVQAVDKSGNVSPQSERREESPR